MATFAAISAERMVIEPEHAAEVPAPNPAPAPDASASLQDGVDEPDARWRDDLFGSPAQAGGATSLLTEDARDGSSNCLDAAVDYLGRMSPAQRQTVELVVLQDTRPGAEGRTGHVVVRQGERVIDPSTGKSHGSTDEYLKAHPEYREAGTLSGDTAERIFATPAGSPERARALEAAEVPPALRHMLLADPAPGDPTSALDEIAKLDNLDPADPIFRGAAPGSTEWNRALNEKRAEIAGQALQDPKPPRREDFEGLNAATANYEYQLALDEHQRQLTELKTIRSAAELFPDRSPQAGLDLLKRAETDPAAARSVAEAIAALKGDPAALKAALAGLTDQQIKKLVEAGVQTTTQQDPIYSETQRFTSTVTYDGALLRQVLDAVSAIDDPALKARFGKPAAAKINELASIKDQPETYHKTGEALRQLRDGLTNLTLSTVKDATSADRATKVQVLRDLAEVLPALDLTGVGGTDLSSSQADKLKQLGPALVKLLTSGETGPLLDDLRGADPRGDAMIEVWKTLIAGGPDNVQAGKQLLDAVEATGSKANLGYTMGSLLVAAESFKDEIDAQKVEESRDRTNVVIAIGFISGILGAVASLGAQRASETDNGAKEKQSLDDIRVDLDRSANVHLDTPGSGGFRDHYDAVLRAHGMTSRAGVA